jgi:hypothetical protein
MTLELYDTTLGDNARNGRCSFALPEGSRTHLPEVFSSRFCSHRTSTFYKRPEDRILLIFHGSGPTGITLIVIFISTLLHFSKPGRLISWDEWKKYTWIADPQESAMLLSPRGFISSSRFLHHKPHPDEHHLLRVTVTSFLPSIEEKPSPTTTTGSVRDGWGERVPLLVAATKKTFDIHPDTEEPSEIRVMMTEDNILIVTVRHSPNTTSRFLRLER